MKKTLPFFNLLKNSKWSLSVLIIFILSNNLFAQNPTIGGSIEPVIQEICFGELPQKITSAAPASGGDASLPIEYMWMYTYNPGSNPGGNSYTAIPNSNSDCYDPGPVYIDTYYVRCARRVGSGNLNFTAESNLAAVLVSSSLSIDILGNPGVGFRGLVMNLSTPFISPAVTYEWDVDGNGTIDDTGLNAYFVFDEPGSYNINLTATFNGCSFTTISPILINEPYFSNINDPCNCDDPLNIADFVGMVYYNHDYILLSSNPGEIWTIIDNAGTGNPIFYPGLDPIPLGDIILETSPGIYYKDIWFDGTQGDWQVTLQSNYGYSLTLNSGINGTCVICPGSPLPVELKNFSASVENNEAVLTWETSSELNNSFFNIERSLDGQHFSTIGIVDGKGTTNATNFYEFIDKRSLSGETYYRLKQVDFDGQFEYSNIVSTKIQDSSSDLILAVSPNPVNKNAIVSLRENIDLNSTLELITSSALVIKTFKLNPTSNSLEINLEGIAEGIYFLSVKNAKSGRKSFYKIVKQ